LEGRGREMGGVRGREGRGGAGQNGEGEGGDGGRGYFYLDGTVDTPRAVTSTVWRALPVTHLRGMCDMNHS